ncbi:MAG: alpha/beta fold hydrolase [Phyllobacteriaceae bacterium]|nr:alpha/beta fold hydrolase [Phyllobacteriaceae bacterium]
MTQLDRFRKLASGAVLGVALAPAALAAEPSDHFTLIHSAWSGGWQWGHVAPALEANGYRSAANDLPGHGADKTPAANIALQSYVQSVVDDLDQLEGTTILVGHSFGGVIASQIAEARPEKVSAIVYLCAFLLPDGVSFLDATKGVETSDVLNNLVFSDAGDSVSIAPDALHQAVAHDVPAEAFAQAEPNLVREPTAPLGEKLVLTDDNYGQVPRYYVECAQDRAIPVDIQRAMHASQGVDHVYTLNASHMPVFSMPDQVVAVLQDIADREKARNLAIKARNGWADAINAGDADAAADFYAPNAIVKAGRFGMLTGRPALRNFWAEMIEQGATDARLFDTSVRVIDESTVGITSGWRMNVGEGRITTEIWRILPDDTAVLRRGEFTMNAQ